MELEPAVGIVEKTHPGETVLLEYVPSYIPEFTLKFFIEYCREKGIPLLIDDNFDTLYILKTHLEKLDVEIDLSDVLVVKTGGRKNVGKVLATVKFHPDPRVYTREYMKAVKPAMAKLEGTFINLVVGVEHLFLLSRNLRDRYSIILTIQKFTGAPTRKAFYLVNKEILEDMSPTVLHEIERVATAVMSMEPMPAGAKVKVVKSLNLKDVGKTIPIQLGGDLIGRT
ncbi:hypothetical protein A3L09_02440 [Thermococcus profundus]|uniref:Uncharacterized protein n=1 Tax=Thermococcus profundus TaxID=49899 RepID=A0A2Z2MDY8_THEPR|nr:DUF257 family protein [Thermococcus profundus]ASJ02204.1 hypothetical protein A3L09_02440 [Thermococcus profundus]